MPMPLFQEFLLFLKECSTKCSPVISIAAWQRYFSDRFREFLTRFTPSKRRATSDFFHSLQRRLLRARGDLFSSVSFSGRSQRSCGAHGARTLDNWRQFTVSSGFCFMASTGAGFSVAILIEE